MRRPLCAALLLAVGLTACGGGDEPAVPADQAAETVVATYGLSPDDQACLETAFAGADGARDALEPGGAPSQAQLDELGELILGCVTPERIGSAVAAAMAAGLGTLDADQERCVATAVVQLPEGDLRILVSGLASPAVIGSVSDRSVQLGEVTNRLFAACSVRVAEGDGSTATTGAGDLGAVPEEDGGSS